MNMCGIVGIANYTKDLSKDKFILEKMNSTLSKRGPDEDGYFIEDCVLFGHKRLIVIDPKGGKQPMSFKINNTTYTIIFNGQIYNSNELMQDLIEEGFGFDGYCDTEVLLKGFVCWGKNVLTKLNGIFSFAIWNNSTKELFLARDYFGTKPLYYTLINGNFIFSSEIKAILQHPEVTTIVDSSGLCELIGLGPAHTPGTSVFKNIFELKPAHFAIYNSSGLYFERYWKLETKEHTDNFSQTCDTVKFLLDDSIKHQLVSDVPLCVMLSGGLDSSIITAYASNYTNSQKLPYLNTFSVDYVDNDKNFVKSDFQPNSDSYYINIMKNKFNTNHHNIIIDTPELVDCLEDAMVARDLPGMADVDASLLLFCKYIKKDASVVLSGECSDEIFAGYPWFFRNDALNSNTFPWSLAIAERQNLLNNNISAQVNLQEYVDYRYNECLSEIEYCPQDSNDTKEKRKITYLTMNWFMQTLLDRSDRMSMFNGLELRVPFCDHRLVQYLWNIPWEIKALNGREKGLLRYIVKDILPSEIVDRKKSPYPKTHNPNYLKKVKNILNDIIINPNSPILSILDKSCIVDIIETNGESFSRPWFGQLMTGPQLMAYLCQVNMWLEKYQPKIEL